MAKKYSSKPVPARESNKPENKNVSIKKVDNGFVISCYGDRIGQDKTKIAKTSKEAKDIASSMLD